VTHEQRIEAITNVLNELRPMIQGHGGNIELVKLEDTTVSIRLSGACVGCPASIFTMTFGVEQAIKERLPDVTQVLLVE